MKLSFTTLALTGLVVLTLMPTAQAQELVFNGGFELIHGGVAPSPAGWNISGNTYLNPTSPHSGNEDVLYESIGYDGVLSQTLNTTVGDTEVISFWQLEAGSKPNEVTLDFGSARLLTLTDLSIGPWTHYTVTTTAASASTLLAFGLRNDGGHGQLDDVSVIQSAPVAVPEPGTMAILGGLSLTGAAFFRRKRAR